MEIQKFTKSVPIAVVAWGTLLSGAAFAGNAYQGSDVSYTVEHEWKVAVCDRESDGHSVKVEAWDYGNIFSGATDGGDAGCDTTSGSGYGWAKHRTIEVISWQPDQVGAWSYH